MIEAVNKFFDEIKNNYLIFNSKYRDVCSELSKLDT